MRLDRINVERFVKESTVLGFLVSSTVVFIWLIGVLFFVRLLWDFLLSTPLGS